MNIFFVLRKKGTNDVELVTAPLTRGDILPGVTRDSIITLAKQWGEFEVSERFLTMQEIIEAESEGRVSVVCACVCVCV
jgi:branched-chain amino acid aminotransferase